MGGIISIGITSASYSKLVKIKKILHFSDEKQQFFYALHFLLKLLFLLLARFK